MARSEEPVAQLYFGELNTEILVLGNSRGLRLFSDSAFEDNLGMSSANLCVQSASTEISLIILKDYLDRNQKPRIVIHEITDLIRKNDAVRILRVYASSSPRLRTIQDQVEPKWAIFGDVFPALDFNNQEFREWSAQVIRGKPSYLYETEMPTDMVSEVSISFPIQYNSTVENLKALAEIHSICEKHQIKYIPVVAPLFPGHRRNIANFDDWIDEVELTLGSDCSSANYSDHEAFAERELYADHTHINRRGVTIFFNLIRTDDRLRK